MKSVVMFVLLFTYVFGGAIQLPPGFNYPYIDYLMPGIFIQTVVFGSLAAAIGLATDLKSGLLERFRSLPMARSAVLAGRTLSDLIRNGFVITLMMSVGFLIDFRWQTDVFGMLGGLLVAMVFAYALSWVMATIGLAVKNPEAAQSAVFLPVFPLVFASSVFLPTATMPDWLRAFAENQPITVTVNAMRGLILGSDALAPGQTVAGQVFLALVWALGILAVFAPLAVRVYRRTVS